MTDAHYFQLGKKLNRIKQTSMKTVSADEDVLEAFKRTDLTLRLSE